MNRFHTQPEPATTSHNPNWDTGELMYVAARVLLPYVMVGLLMVAFG